MADTEDIITGELPEEETIHYAEQHLLLFRDKELAQLFALLKKYYQDSVDDSESLRQGIINIINTSYNNSIEYTNNIKSEIETEMQTCKQELIDLIHQLIPSVKDEVMQSVEQTISNSNNTQIEQLSNTVSNLTTTITNLTNTVNTNSENINTRVNVLENNLSNYINTH